MISSETGADIARGDVGRQAVASLGGYAYQIYASALAWVRLKSDESLYIEVAEDYAVASSEALRGVQVKETAGSGRITLQSEDVRTAIDTFVDLTAAQGTRRGPSSSDAAVSDASRTS